MNQRIILRADAGKDIGYGHFFRSIALAGYLKNQFECKFVTFNSDNITSYQLNAIDDVAEYLRTPGEDITDFNINFLNLIKNNDIVVLDNYYYTTEYQQKIKDKGCKLVCIDDMHDRHMVCDLLFTPCPLKREDFSLESYTKFEGGIEWSFLRKPFLETNKTRNISDDIQRVVIAMGGADPFNLSNEMIKIVHEVLPCAEIHVMAGDTVTISEELSKITIIHKFLSAEEIVELFDNSDLGVFPASTVCIEAISRMLPVAAGYYVDNQKEFYEYGIEHNLFSPLGKLLDEPLAILSRFKDVVDNNRPVPNIIDFSKQREKIITLFKELKSK